MNVKGFFLALFLGVFVVLIVLYGQRFQGYNFSQKAFLGEIPINLSIIDKPALLVRGLSLHKPINKNEGLLFVFKEPDFHGIWMKDMKFAIDVVWLNEDKKVIHIREDFSPGSYPEVAYPDAKSLYVLEVGSGFVKDNKITTGMELKILEKEP